jgi:hypothetical protein
MIHASIDSNEAMRPRADLILKAIASDDHFEEAPGETPFDLRFERTDTCENFEKVVGCEPCDHGPCIKNRVLHIEVKDFSEAGNSDYLSSILSGHLWGQCQAAREIGEPFVIAVLGGDEEVNAACKAAASRKHRLDVDKMLKYFAMVDGFEANAIGQGIQVWRLKTDPYGRLLLRARKILEGGNLEGFCPKPADGERQAVGLSILAGRGVGPKMAANILERYNLCLILRDGYCGDLMDCEGIGPKRAETIRKNVEVMK